MTLVALSLPGQQLNYAHSSGSTLIIHTVERDHLRLLGAPQAFIKIASERSLRCSAWAAAQLYSEGATALVPSMNDSDRLPFLEALRVHLTAAVRYSWAAARTSHASSPVYPSGLGFWTVTNTGALRV